MRELAVWVDDFALRDLPGVEADLVRTPARVMRSFARLPNPATVGQLGQYQQVAVLGGADFGDVVRRVELATTSLRIGVIGVLPVGVASAPQLRGPGVVDLIPANFPSAARRIALMAEVPIVSGRARAEAPAPPERPGFRKGDEIGESRGPLLPAGSAAIAIASSTGGCWVLADLIRALQGRAVGPILVAQHMDPGFVGFFGKWLETTTGSPTCVVSERTALLPGTVYVAQGGCDLVVPDAQYVDSAPASGRFIPSANKLFQTFALAFGARGTAVVLSGMGEDGAEGLGAVVSRGGRGLCQLPSSAIIPSMPASALKAARGAMALTPEGLAGALLLG